MLHVSDWEVRFPALPGIKWGIPATVRRNSVACPRKTSYVSDVKGETSARTTNVRDSGCTVLLRISEGSIQASKKRSQSGGSMWYDLIAAETVRWALDGMERTKRICGGKGGTLQSVFSWVF